MFQQIKTGDSLRFNGIGKNFPGVRALSDISFAARPGTVHALMGENGAGWQIDTPEDTRRRLSAKQRRSADR